MLRILQLGTFRNAYLFRGLAVWVGLRLAAAFVGIPQPDLAQKFLILGVVGLAVWLDARRRDEDLFLANLGVPGFAIVATALIVPLLLEGILP
jgi:hypothetical protein